MIADSEILIALEAKIDQLLVAAKAGPSRFMRIDAAARYTGLSVESVRRLISAGKLTALRPCRGAILLDRLEIDAVVLSSTNGLRRGRGRTTRKPTNANAPPA